MIKPSVEISTNDLLNTSINDKWLTASSKAATAHGLDSTSEMKQNLAKANSHNTQQGWNKTCKVSHTTQRKSCNGIRKASLRPSTKLTAFQFLSPENFQPQSKTWILWTDTLNISWSILLKLTVAASSRDIHRKASAQRIPTENHQPLFITSFSPGWGDAVSACCSKNNTDFGTYPISPFLRVLVPPYHLLSSMFRGWVFGGVTLNTHK